MQNLVFTQLSIPEVRKLLREELESFFDRQPQSENGLVSVIEAWENFCNHKVKRNSSGKLLNRSSAYDWAARLPEEVKVRVGRTVWINLPRLRAWLDEGGDLSNAA